MSFSLSGTVITQSGTDADLSGLVGNGCTQLLNEHVNIYDMGLNTMKVLGDLTIEPDSEMLITGANGNVPNITVEGTLRIGSETIVNGKSRLSSGVAIVGTGLDTVSTGEWKMINYGLIYLKGGTLITRGGTIISSRGIGLYTQYTIDSVGTTFTKHGTSLRREIRFDSTIGATSGSKFAGIIDGFQISHRALPDVFQPSLSDGEIVQLAHGGAENTLSEVDISSNIAINTDLGTDDFNNGSGDSHKIYNIINCSNGSEIRLMPKSGVGTNRQLGGCYVKKEVEFTITDSSSVAAQGTKLHLIDTDNGYRKNANEENNLADKIYEATTDTNGSSGKLTVTTAISNIDSEGTFVYSDWDTTLYSNRYKVDRRGNDGTTSDLFTFNLCDYRYNLSPVTLALRGLGVLYSTWTMFDDVNVTQLNKATVDAYTTLGNNNELYDRAKAYLYDNFDGESVTYVLNSVGDIGSADLTMGEGESSAFAYNSGDMTIKLPSSGYTGTVKTTGAVTLTSSTDLSNLVIDGDLKINITADATLAFSNVTVTGNILNVSSNTLTINAANGSSLTTTEPGSADGQVDIQNSVEVKITVQDTAGLKLPGARVFIKRTSDNVSLYNDVTDVNGEISFLYNYASDETITGRVRKSTSSPLYVTGAITGTINSIGFNSTITMVLDE